MSNPLGYDCDYCGACCTKLLVEAGALDALREPGLLQLPHAPSIDQLIEDEAKAILLHSGHGCPFLNMQSRGIYKCSIYATRPDCCVGVLAGDAKCQQARELAGLSPLQPTGKATIEAMTWNQQYGLDDTGAA